jgi:hypothetical protein
MSQSVTSALNSARERTAGPGDWQSATLTDITPLDTPDSFDGPSPLSMTVTTSDGTELVWEVSDQTVGDEFREGATVWIRQGDARNDPVPIASERWNRSGQWLLESPAARQRRHSLVHRWGYRWGRLLTTTILFLDLTLGRWWLVLQLGLISALAIFVEPAWAIVLAGLLILACEEVALMAFSE